MMMAKGRLAIGSAMDGCFFLREISAFWELRGTALLKAQRFLFK